MRTAAVTVMSLPPDRLHLDAYSVAFSAGGARLAVGCFDGVLWLIDRGGPRAPVRVRGRPLGWALLFDGTGDHVFAGSTAVSRVTWATGAAGTPYRGHKVEPSHLALSPDGARLYTATAGVLVKDSCLRAFDVATGNLSWKARPMQRLHGCRGVAEASGALVAAWDDGTVHLHAREDGASRSAVQLEGAASEDDGLIAGLAAIEEGFVAAWIAGGVPRITWLTVVGERLVVRGSVALAAPGGPRASLGRPVLDPRGHVVVGLRGFAPEADGLSLAVVDAQRTLVDEVHLPGASSFYQWAFTGGGEVAWTRQDGIGFARWP